MNRKRCLCVVLALLLAGRVSRAAELEEAPPGPPEAPTIQVLVPDSGRMIVNPYGLAVDADGGTSYDQVIHAPQALSNQSDVAVWVDARAVGRVWGGAYLADQPPFPGETGKALFLYAEFRNEPMGWRGWFGDLPDQLRVTDWGEEKQGVLTLEPWSDGWFRLSGTAAVPPEDPWRVEDTADVTLAFTFTAVEEPGGAANEELPGPEELPDMSEEPSQPEEAAPPEEIAPPEDAGPPEEAAPPEDVTLPDETVPPEEAAPPEDGSDLADEDADIDESIETE